jgi:hypothetical protein
LTCSATILARQKTPHDGRIEQKQCGMIARLQVQFKTEIQVKYNKLYSNATGCLKTILEKKTLGNPFFCDNLNSSAYIVSKELNLDSDSISGEIISQAKYILTQNYWVFGFFHQWIGIGSFYGAQLGRFLHPLT